MIENQRTTRGPSGGFTIAELVCVLVIISIIAAIAAPRYANALARYRAELAAARIVADLSLAQRQARFSSSGQNVIFDVGDDTVELAGLPDPDHPGQDYVVRLGQEPYRANLVSVNLGGDAEIVFDGFGQPDSGGTIVVSAGNCAKQIALDSATARATVTDIVVIAE